LRNIYPLLINPDLLKVLVCSLLGDFYFDCYYYRMNKEPLLTISSNIERIVYAVALTGV